MGRMESSGSRSTAGRRAPRVVKVPKLLVTDSTGVGDLIKRVTMAAGVPTCGGCERRAKRLNDWMQLRPRN